MPFLQEFEVAVMSKDTKETLQLLEVANDLPQLSPTNLLNMARLCFDATVKDICAGKRALQLALSRIAVSKCLAPDAVSWVRPLCIGLLDSTLLYWSLQCPGCLQIACGSFCLNRGFFLLASLLLMSVIILVRHTAGTEAEVKLKLGSTIQS